MIKEFTKGIFRENPILVIVLGLCPTLAPSTRVLDAVGMGLAATFVLAASNVIISLCGRYFPDQIRIPCYIVVVATFVTCTDMVMAAYVPDIHANLGIFLPLIVVNCIILGRAEAFAARNRPLPSLLDGLGMGLGFSLVLVSLAVVREVAGAGSFAGLPLTSFYRDGAAVNPVLILVQPPGAFLLIAIFMGLANYLRGRKAGGS